MNNHDNINFSVSMNHHTISKQGSLKYLAVILDDKLNWKPQEMENNAKRQFGQPNVAKEKLIAI